MLGEIVCGVPCQFLSGSTVNPVSKVSHIHPLLTMAGAGGEQAGDAAQEAEVYQQFADTLLPMQRAFIVFQTDLGPDFFSLRFKTL